jgi:hypothetical protein
MIPLLPEEIVVVGVMGKAGSGKDEFANVLKDNLGFYKIPMAQRLKAAACAVFDLAPDDVDTPEGKARMNDYWGMTNRQLLQTMGTEAMQPIFGKDVWVKGAIRTMLFLHTQGAKKFVMPDIRFAHELAFISAVGGKVVYIERENLESKLTETEQAHASEPNDIVDLIQRAGVMKDTWFLRNADDLEGFKLICLRTGLDIMKKWYFGSDPTPENFKSLT